MTNLNDAIELLRAKRQALLAQLSAVDQALDALASAADATTPAETSSEPVAPPPTPDVVPAKIKSPRMLSDEHKHALNEGRRKARHLADVKAGRAREMTDPSTAQAGTDSRLPRLVKRAGR